MSGIARSSAATADTRTATTTRRVLPAAFATGHRFNEHAALSSWMSAEGLEGMTTAMTSDYAGHQVLFRQAKARAMAARRFATQANQNQAHGQSGTERRQREQDAVITALVLTQGAAEGYANWVHVQAGTTVTGKSWIRRWEKLAEAAAILDRPTGGVLRDDHRAFLAELGAWRNYFLHADATARERLHTHLANSGINQSVSPPDLLTADLAETIIHKADQLFRWAEDTTGIPAPFLDAAWVAIDEY